MISSIQDLVEAIRRAGKLPSFPPASEVGNQYSIYLDDAANVLPNLDVDAVISDGPIGWSPRLICFDKGGAVPGLWIGRRHAIDLMRAHPNWKTICDPFMGFGDIGEFVLSEGRKFVGIEIHQPTYEKARQRLGKIWQR